MPDYGNVKKYAAFFEDAICESKICLRAVVAVAIRCARRVQPRFQIPVREPEFSDELIRAIMVAERFATKSQPDVRVDFDYSVANGADLYGLWAENVNLLHPANAAFAAHYAARSALHAQISGGDYARRNPPFASTEARSAIHYAAKAAAHSSIAAIVGGDEENATSRTLSDIKVLKELELGEFPEFGDAVDFDRIGPLWASKEPNWVTTRIEEFIEESETGIDFEEEAVPSLSLFFDTTEFSALEIASIISQLSLLYKSISDDVLVIEGTTLFQPNTNPVGV